MADLYLKRLEAERKKLWATCRLKGLPSMSAERERIAELDRLIKAHQNKSSLSRRDGEGDRSAKPNRGGAGATLEDAEAGMAEMSERYNEGGRELYIGAGGREHD